MHRYVNESCRQDFEICISLWLVRRLVFSYMYVGGDLLTAEVHAVCL